MPAPDAAAQTPEAASAPAPESADTHGSADPQDDEDRTLVTLAAPRAVVAAFDEAVDLYRAVEGGEGTVTSFVEALVGEAAAGGDPPDALESAIAAEAHRERAGLGPSPAVIERSLASSTERWRHLPRSSDASWGLALGRSTLARLAVIARAPDDGSPAERLARMKELLAIENDVEIHLGRPLASMGEQEAWNRLRFAGMAHYAEERLGLSRTAAQSRARAARALGRFPLLRAAYEHDTVGLEATLLVGRILSGAGAAGQRGPQAEHDWVRHAAEATFKRLRDEARALDRTRAFGLDTQNRSGLLQDADWHASLRRTPGIARRRVIALGLIALGVRTNTSDAPAPDAAAAPTAPAFCPATALIPEPDVFLRLTLPDELAGGFLAAVEHARQTLAEQVESIPWDADWPGPADAGTPAAAATPALLAARTFSIRSRRVPAWVGLLALIEDFVATWDPDVRGDDVPDDPILVRDGWRCAAPACSSRRSLEVHHVVYRSHGGLARCSGRAPLGLTWRLGAGEIASSYRNEGRLRSSRRPV